jgi:hypothetical protein
MLGRNLDTLIQAVTNLPGHCVCVTAVSEEDTAYDCTGKICNVTDGVVKVQIYTVKAWNLCRVAVGEIHSRPIKMALLTICRNLHVYEYSNKRSSSYGENIRK